MNKIKNRCRSLDRNKLAPAIGLRDKNDVASDWGDTERILETNFEKVLLFQRGDKDKNREYHIVLGPEDNLYCLLKYSGGVVGYDTKYDFMAARFKTSAVTFCDNQNKGRVGILGLCNREDTNTHTLHFQMMQVNMPCSTTNCTHDGTLHIFNDYNGHFWTRPCAFDKQFAPIIQHDKARYMRSAVIHQRLETSLCNFHGLAAYREHIQHPALKTFS